MTPVSALALLLAALLSPAAFAQLCLDTGNPESLTLRGDNPTTIEAAANSRWTASFWVEGSRAERLRNVTVDFRLQSGSGLSFVGTGDPLHARATSDSLCGVWVPTIAASGSVVPTTIEARFVFNPGAGEILSAPFFTPVSVVANAPATLSPAEQPVDIVGAGAPLQVRARVAWRYASLSARPVVFTTTPPGAATFPNGQQTISVLSDDNGFAQTTLSVRQAPFGGVKVLAQTADQEVMVGRYFGTADVGLGTPEPMGEQVYGGHGVAKMAPTRFPCSTDYKVDTTGRWILAEGDAVSPFPFSECYKGSLSWNYAYLDQLTPGTHELRIGFRGDTHETIYSQPFTVTVTPQLTMPAARGGVTLKLGISPSRSKTGFLCELIDLRAGVEGGPGMPATLPPDVSAPWGLVSFELFNCRWDNYGFDVPPPSPPLVQRTYLASDGALPPNAAVWVHGTWRDATGADVTEWREVPSAKHANGVTFETEGIHKPTIAIGVRANAAHNYQDLWWAGPEENGWGLSVTQRGDQIFAVLYIYDEAGQARWLALPGGSWDAQKRTFSAAVYRPEGSPSWDYDPAKFRPGPSVGTAQLEYTGDDALSLRFTIDGIAGEKRLARQRFGRPSVIPYDPNFDGLWWGGASQDGWGLALHQQGNSLFAIWFTYDSDGKTTWYAAPSLSLLDVGSVKGPLYSTTGSPWLGAAYDPARLVVTPAGTFNLRRDHSTTTFSSPYPVEVVPQLF